MRELDVVTDEDGDLGVSSMRSGWVGADSKDEGGLSVVIPQEWTGYKTRDDRVSERTIVGGAVG